MPESFRVTRMYHPSFHAPDLDEVESWFARVFGAPSTNIYETFKGRDNGDYPTSYSTFTPMADVLMDTIAPTRYVLNGVQQYASVDKPHLKTIGWFDDNPEAVYQALRTAGIAMVNQFRNVPGWTPAAAPEGPLGLVRCAYHTLLTDNPQRALHTLVDALGGRVIHESRDEVIGATARYVLLADTVLQVAVPDQGTAAHADWTTTAPNDTYHSLTFQVADLDRAADHLKSQGVSLRSRTDDTLVTDPDTSINVPWGFTAGLVPGDTRG